MALLVGTYQYKSGSTQTISLSDDRLFIQYKDYPPEQIYYAGDNRFYYGDKNLSWFEITPSDNRVEAISMHLWGRDKAQIGSRVPTS